MGDGKDKIRQAATKSSLSSWSILGESFSSTLSQGKKTPKRPRNSDFGRRLANRLMKTVDWK